jgi:hypothetical protein
MYDIHISTLDKVYVNDYRDPKNVNSSVVSLLDFLKKNNPKYAPNYLKYLCSSDKKSMKHSTIEKINNICENIKKRDELEENINDINIDKIISNYDKQNEQLKKYKDQIHEVISLIVKIENEEKKYETENKIIDKIEEIEEIDKQQNIEAEADFKIFDTLVKNIKDDDLEIFKTDYDIGDKYNNKKEGLIENSDSDEEISQDEEINQDEEISQDEEINQDEEISQDEEINQDKEIIEDEEISQDEEIIEENILSSKELFDIFNSLRISNLEIDEEIENIGELKEHIESYIENIFNMFNPTGSYLLADIEKWCETSIFSEFHTILYRIKQYKDLYENMNVSINRNEYLKIRNIIYLNDYRIIYNLEYYLMLSMYSIIASNFIINLLDNKKMKDTIKKEIMEKYCIPWLDNMRIYDEFKELIPTNTTNITMRNFMKIMIKIKNCARELFEKFKKSNENDIKHTFSNYGMEYNIKLIEEYHDEFKKIYTYYNYNISKIVYECMILYYINHVNNIKTDINNSYTKRLKAQEKIDEIEKELDVCNKCMEKISLIDLVKMDYVIGMYGDKIASEYMDLFPENYKNLFNDIKGEIVSDDEIEEFKFIDDNNSIILLYLCFNDSEK